MAPSRPLVEPTAGAVRTPSNGRRRAECEAGAFAILSAGDLASPHVGSRTHVIISGIAVVARNGEVGRPRGVRH